MDLSFGNAAHFLASYRRPAQPGQPRRALVAVRPIGATYTPGSHIDDPSIASAQCASTAQKSLASATSNGPYAASHDDLRAAAKIALQRIVGPAEILSIEPFHWSRPQET